MNIKLDINNLSFIKATLKSMPNHKRLFVNQWPWLLKYLSSIYQAENLDQKRRYLGVEVGHFVVFADLGVC